MAIETAGEEKASHENLLIINFEVTAINGIILIII